MINLIFAEQQGLVRAGMACLLHHHSNINLVANVSTGKELLAVLDKHSDAVILLSSNIQDMSVVALIKKIKRDLKKSKLLVLANDVNAILARQYMLAGADGYLVKTISEKNLIESLYKLQQNKVILPEELAQSFANNGLNEADTPFEILSGREMDILLLMVRGKSIKAISEILHLSPKTISTYKGRIFEKLNAKSMMDVFLLAVEYGLIRSENIA